jgi:exodeoxyribonuclease V alpha subunit
MVAFPGNSDEGLEAVEYLAPIRLPNHETAFAMTIHKSQGSEFEHALIVLPTKESPILTRELIYTGVTRGKKRITILSDKKVLLDGLTKRVKRASGLAELLG